MCPPCAGSGVLPAGSTKPSDFRELLNTAICGSPRSEDSSDSDYMPTLPATEAFLFPTNPPRLIKRIPRAARHWAAIAFEKCLWDVVSSGELEPWRKLLAFPMRFRLPARTGRRHNLTSQIMSQIEEHVQLAQQAVHHPVADTHSKQKPRVRIAMES